MSIAISKKEIVGLAHKLPNDLQIMLLSNLKILAFWEDLTLLARNEWICWTITTKKQETRDNHIERTITELLEGMRSPCCWAGCIHRSKS